MTESPTAADRHDYVREKRTQLDELSTHIRALETRLKKTDTDAWIKAVSHFEGLKEQHTALQRKVEDAQHAPHHSWEDVKRGIEHAWAELERAIEKVRLHHKLPPR